MSKIFRYIIPLTLGIVLWSCKKEIHIPEPEVEKPEAPYIKVEENELKVPTDGGVYILGFSSNAEVSYTCPDWCDLSLMHDSGFSDKGSMKITVAANTTRQERVGEIVFSAEECDDAVITVKQLNRELSDVCGISGLTIAKSHNGRLAGDVVFTFDKTANTFSAMYLKWIEGDSPESLVPDIEFEGEKVMVNGTEVVSGETSISFADDFELEVYAENGDKKTYNVVFNCPQINTEVAVLHMKPSQLISSKDVYVNTEIELFDKSKGSARDGWWDSKTDGSILMRLRGNSTKGLPKVPYRMKFPVKCSPIGFNHTSERNWVLLAQDMDKSLLRTYIAFEYSKLLFDKNAGYHDSNAALFTPESKYVNVYLTGQYYDSSKREVRNMQGDYLGLYQMCDRIDRGKGRLDIEPLTALDGNNPSLISGGYLLEADLHEGNHLTARKGIKFSYKYPKDDDCHYSQYDYISNYVNKAEAALYAPDFTDPVNGWRKYFDEKTLADFIIIKELVGDMDGYTSIYIYKKRHCDKFFFGPIWDCDKGWKNDIRVPHWESHPDHSLMIHAGFWMPPYVNHDWFHRFWEDASFRKFVSERWKSKREALLALTERVLQEMPEQMKKAIKANYTVWDFNYQHNSGEAARPQKDYKSEISYIGKVTKDRARLLDDLFAR